MQQFLLDLMLTSSNFKLSVRSRAKNHQIYLSNWHKNPCEHLQPDAAIFLLYLTSCRIVSSGYIPVVQEVQPIIYLLVL